MDVRNGFPADSKAPRRLVGLLTAIYLLNFLDRQIVTILAAPIKADLHLTNTELGLITGLAFALFYALLGLPIAWLAERLNRVWLIAGSLALWSAMTAVCGLSANFAQLFAARIGVGIGEAGCVPASHSLISATVSPRQRATALGVFALGIPLGTLAGMALGGWIATSYGWRAAFLIVGLPGLALAGLLLGLVKDPRHDQGGPRRHYALSTRRIVARLIGKRSYCLAVSGGALASAGSYGILGFLGIYVPSHFGLTLAQAGLVLGAAIGLGGTIGSAAGGWLADRFVNRRALVFIPASTLLAAAPCLAAALLIDHAGPALALFVLGTCLSGAWYGPTFAVLQGVSPVDGRATASALFTLAVNLVGLGCGPVLVGSLSDYLAHPGAGLADSDAALGHALLAGTLLFVLAAACFFFAASAIERDFEG